MRLRLSAAVEERNHLLEIVAHDLKNPLGGVQFAASMLTEEAGSLSLRQAQLVDSISHSAERALEITASLLQTRRLEEAKAHLDLVPLCLQEQTEQAVKVFFHQAGDKGTEVRVECLATSVHVKADRPSLLCVLENLVSNAIKFSPPGSRVCIRISSEGNEGFFRIEDQGPGVREDERSKLFRKFTRLSARPTGDELSTGLGLHIVHELVKAMGGKVGYEDTPHGGACFVVTLPLAR